MGRSGVQDPTGKSLLAVYEQWIAAPPTLILKMGHILFKRGKLFICVNCSIQTTWNAQICVAVSERFIIYAIGKTLETKMYNATTQGRMANRYAGVPHLCPIKVAAIFVEVHFRRKSTLVFRDAVTRTTLTQFRHGSNYYSWTAGPFKMGHSTIIWTVVNHWPRNTAS
jgi:hypothetical protein